MNYALEPVLIVKCSGGENFEFSLKSLGCPLSRRVSWLTIIFFKPDTDHLLEGAIQFASKIVSLLEWNRSLHNGYRSNQDECKLGDLLA